MSHISKDEVILAFLRAEYESNRFGSKISKMLIDLDRDKSLLFDANLKDNSENIDRRKIMSESRGYPDRSLFHGFPRDVIWEVEDLTLDQLSKLYVIKQGKWIHWTNETRMSREVLTYMSKTALLDAELDNISGIVDRIKNGESFPPVILVGTARDHLVILEGHMRIISYLVVADGSITVKAYIGMSPSMGKWHWY
ncbi:MAG: hypothetical protein U5O15_08070 [Candidatus Krumholzibacteriota bacterium]|nr:hypothetical protein [Candidatus Krumholzibacteriota bacterium]